MHYLFYIYQCPYVTISFLIALKVILIEKVFYLQLPNHSRWRRKTLQCSCLENPRGRGAWWAAVYGVAQSRTRLKRLSSSSSSIFWTLTDIYSAAAAKSPQLCPTLCDPIDSSPPGSPAPGILQARTLEWVAISFRKGVCQGCILSPCLFNLYAE